jgi:hypothetical protein
MYFVVFTTYHLSTVLYTRNEKCENPNISVVFLNPINSMREFGTGSDS